MMPDEGADEPDAAPAEDDSLLRSAAEESDTFLRAVAAAPVRRPASPRLATGTIVDGTFRIESELGAGAMGVVYMATDLALDRRVALKLHSSMEDDVRASRMWREAKAMARLSDPNVIAVHEVGVFDDRVYIAMELVDGGAVSEWQATTRTWQEVVDVYTQAARGLAAAHRVGLVHRDFKASNMLIGTDGRVRVADFGLARAAGDPLECSAAGSMSMSRSGPVSIDDRLTATGVTMGTPAYMAPEQLEGIVDHRSDQYSFCVAMHEALYGVRPFVGGSHEIREAALAGRARPPHEGRIVPQWLRQIVLRGLRPLPEDRFANMDAVVSALQSDPTRGRRLRIAMASAGVAIASLTGTAVYLGNRTPGPDCSDRAALLGTVWDDDVRQRVRDAVLGSGVVYAAETLTRIEAGLDAYADGWMAIAEPACEQTGAPLSAGLRDAQALCLEHRKQAMSALVDVLAVADVRTVERSVNAIAGLPGVDACEDVDALGAVVPPPGDPAVASAVEEVRAEIAEAMALELAGHFAEALAIAEPALVRARDLGYGPLLAEALNRVGRIQNLLGDYAVAEAQLRDGYVEAVAAGDDDVAANTAIQLVHVVGNKLARHDDGLEWGVVARALVRRLGLGGRHEATLLGHLGAVHQVRGEFATSLDHHRRALAILEPLLGPDHLEVARTTNDMGLVQRLQGNFPASIESHTRALAIRERALGPEHPAVAGTIQALAAAYFESGDREQALVQTRRALALRERSLGPDHPDVAAVLANLGNILERRGDYDEALAVLERALRIDTATVGPDHPDVASTTESIGNVYLAKGDPTAALQRYRTTLAIREKALGPDHPHVGLALTNIALAEHDLGNHTQAVAAARRALAISEAALGPDHVNVANAREILGNQLAQLGQQDLALAEHQRALAIREAALGPTDPQLAQSHINIGNVYEARGEYTTALEHNLRALTISEAALGPDHADVALALYNVAQSRVYLDDHAAALPELERALRISERTLVTPVQVADIQFYLSRVLVATGGDRVRARSLAQQALDAYPHDASTQPLRATVTAWLAELDGDRR